MKSQIFDITGKKAGERELSDNVFGLKSNDALLHQVFVSGMANRRTVIAHTKDRGERQGSGIKPWRQKGTGRARAGSVRSPLWKKGGVTFGPTNARVFKKDVPHAMKRKALLIALSEKVRSGKLIVINEFNFSQEKTKAFQAMIKGLKLSGSVLVGIGETEKVAARISRNIDRVMNLETRKLNVVDLLNNQNLILTSQSIDYLEKQYQPKTSAK